MIILKILAWLFIAVLIFVSATFLLAIYDALNFKKEKLDNIFTIVREILKETVLTFVSIITYIPGFINYDNLFLKKKNKQYLPVLLVHGYTMNRACFLFIHLRLAIDGFRVFTVNLYPPFLSIEELSERVADKVDEITDKTGEKEVYLIGHSMGGLVARYYVNSPRGTGRVKQIITIATPHRGTRIAVLGNGKNAREMIPESEFLKQLNNTHHLPTLAIWSTLDNLIIPPEYATLDGMQNIALPFQGHLSLLYSNLVYKHIYNYLTKNM